MKVLRFGELPILEPEDSIDTAKAKIIASGLPVAVFDSSKKFKGIVDEYVIIRNMFKQCELKSIAIMPPGIKLDRPIEEQLPKLKEIQTSCYIASQKGKLVGIVLREDLMYSIKHLFAGKRVKEVLRDLISVYPGESLSSIVHKFGKSAIRTVAVVDGNNVIGFIKPYDLLAVATTSEKGVIPAVKSNGAVVKASDIMVTDIPVIDEKGSLERAIDALLSTPYGVIASNGRPIGSISLSSIACALRPHSSVNLVIDGLSIEDADIVHSKLIRILEKIYKKKGIKSAYVYAKKQGHGVYVLRLTIDHDHFIEERKDIVTAIMYIAEAIKNKYLGKSKYGKTRKSKKR